MTIEIKSVHGKTLYVAEGAKDVREAVVMARREDADLADANLAGADLAGAILAGANLTYANLTYANLARANLTDANLARANLTYANLAYANLADANLAYAYLADAYLAGADLADAYLAGADLADAYLARANLTDANLADANLTDANLADANLTYANLARANLTYAYLAGADLADANLAYANLTYAKGFNPLRVNELLMLRDQPGPIRAYKLVTADGYGPFNGGIRYEIGKKVEVADANTEESVQCGAGINVATMPWVLKNWRPGFRVLVVEFTAKDIAAIPVGDGKFRLHRCRVVGEKTLADLGLE